MVATPKEYFLPRFTMRAKNEAVSSDFIIHQASSMMRRRLFKVFRIAAQMWFVMRYVATAFSSSSMSLIEKTTNLLSIEMFDGWLIKPDHVPRLYFVSLS